ncbi:MAG: cation:proton antiporter [Chloroflexi bacterium]|nr:cation:proton antiporter [Chloroflexota bacterium]
MVAPLVTEPVGVFLTIMAVILIAPLLSERIRLPGIVGLILGGILVGPHGLRLLAKERTIELLSTVGLIYLMFSAGLEIDLRQFGRVRNKSLLFGLFTFAIPQLSGAALGYWLGLGWAGAVLLGSVFSSHTLVAFPILSRLGIVRNEAVAVTIGATVFTDVASLLMLAVIAGTQRGDTSALSVVWLITLMIGYAMLVIWGLPRAGKLFFQRFTSGAIEFQFVLVALFTAALLAEQIGMHAIVGAFLAGLAINSTLPAQSPVVGRVLFLGESFFIPIFLMYIGMITDPLAIVVNLKTLLTGLALTAAVYVTKFVAAWLTTHVLRYSRDELFTMWGLSQAQAAATLATILVGVEIDLFPMTVFNGAILMILCTSITSPLLVRRFGSRLHPPQVSPEKKRLVFDKILVSVANPKTQEHLITLASILARTSDGMLLPLHVAQETHGRIPDLEHQRRLLEAEVLNDPETTIQPIRRVDTSIAKGILHAAIENEASLIVTGWRGKPTFRQSIFGTVLDDVVWHATVPVLVGRLTTPINGMQRVVLVIPPNSLVVGLAAKTLEMVTAIAQAINVPLLVLTAPLYLANLREQLAKLELEYPCKIARLESNLIQNVVDNVDEHDLIVVTTMGSRRRFRSSLGYVPEQLAAAISGSIVVIHYP